MKLHKIGILLITLLVGLAFTSCEDEEWVRARLDKTTYPNNPMTDSDGYLDITFEMFDTDIRGYDPRRDRLLNMEIPESSLSFYSDRFYYNDRLEITLETDTRTRLDLRLYVDRDGYAYIDDRDQAYRNFMYDVINQLINRGRIELYVFVDTGVSQRIPIEVELLNDLNLYVRY